MESNRCNFNQSKALKALGFSWSVNNHYFDNEPLFGTALNYNFGTDLCVSRPTVQDAIRWFRVEKGVHGWVESNWHFEGFRFLFCIGTSFYPWKQTVEGFKSPDEAENALLNRLIEISNQEKA